jgi:hypothetical protein
MSSRGSSPPCLHGQRTGVPSGCCFCARWGGAKDLLLLFRVPHTPLLRVGPRFLSPALPHAGAPSFVPALRAGGACALEDVAKRGSLPCSPTRARTHICHPEEVRPHVFMRMNDEPGSPAGAAFAPVGVGRGICFCFFACPTRCSCVWVLVFCLPLSCMRVPHPSCPPYAQAELARLKTSRRVGRSLVAHGALTPTFVIPRRFARMSSCG